MKLPFEKKMGSFNNKLNLSGRHEYETNQPLPTLHLASSHFGFSFKAFGPYILSDDKVYIVVCQLNSIQAS